MGIWGPPARHLMWHPVRRTGKSLRSSCLAIDYFFVGPVRQSTCGSGMSSFFEQCAFGRVRISGLCAIPFHTQVSVKSSADTQCAKACLSARASCWGSRWGFVLSDPLPLHTWAAAFWRAAIRERWWEWVAWRLSLTQAGVHTYPATLGGIGAFAQAARSHELWACNRFVPSAANMGP